ncbi:MAG: hypothetical protein DRQ64_10100 [Gammaproteobacteria bacterium]|nr:MAG: hypothetical protein DRQ64_10100 [Gammaproteobacteria bacterium]
MKQVFKKNPKMVKGMPSAVVLSILIHVGLFLLAGMLVVFTVVKKEEQKFEPPTAVERPKMKLRKPKVKVKRTSKPKSTTRIVTKVDRASMPDIQLPEMSGMGEGFGGDIGGFDMLPDLGEVTMFGAGQSIGNDFVGTFYDSKRDREGRTLPVDTSGEAWRNLIHKFLLRGWDLSVFSRCYRSPRKLYATNLVVPVTYSSIAPVSFSDEDSVGALWMVHYKGELVHKEAITFRLWGMADEFMAVRVDGELVLAFDWPHPPLDRRIIGKLWVSDSADSRKYYIGNNRSVVGDWITLEPGEPLDMEILIGDNGGAGSFYLAVEVEGVEYERNRQGGPILPAFKTAELSHDLLDIIYRELPEGEISLTNGPVFCDYDVSGKAPTPKVEDPDPVAPSVTDDSAANGMRMWTMADGRTLEAEFVNIFGGKVVLKNGRGKTRKVPKEQLSGEDIEYAELASPPDLDINFLKNFRQETFSGGFYDIEYWERPSEEWGHFGVQLKQTSPGEYNHELQVEMFVVGSQRGGDKHLLLDRQQFAFNPARAEQRFFEFRSDRKVVLHKYVIYWYYSREFGEKYAGCLVTVKDERGETIAVESSSKWLVENLENLKKLSVGNYMDKTCTRTFPSRPKTLIY